MKNVKLKLKDEKGFTVQDIIAASIIIFVFVGSVTMLMNAIYENNIKTKLNSKMTIYAVEILEDIDKISYEEAQSKTAQYYIDRYSIPNGFEVSLEFQNYGENLEDIIKIVNLKISYTFKGETEEFNVQKLKIKEM